MPTALSASPWLDRDVTDEQITVQVRDLFAAGEDDSARELFGRLVTRHQARACRIARYYLRSLDEADEAVQDAFVKAFVHLSSFREELSFDVWLTRILVNCCLDRLKARRRRLRWLDPATSVDEVRGQHTTLAFAPEPSPEDLAVRRDRRRRLVGAIRTLPVRQREVVTLSALEGHSTREVSALTGLSEATVRVHLFRAVRKLRALLPGERGRTS